MTDLRMLEVPSTLINRSRENSFCIDSSLLASTTTTTATTGSELVGLTSSDELLLSSTADHSMPSTHTAASAATASPENGIAPTAARPQVRLFFYATNTSSSSSTPPATAWSNHHKDFRLLLLLNDPVMLDRLSLLGCITGWYIIGVGAIVTTKILLTDWSVPPLVLTFQQLLAGSSILKLVLAAQGPGAIQPLPWEQHKSQQQQPTTTATTLAEYHSLAFPPELQLQQIDASSLSAPLLLPLLPSNTPRTTSLRDTCQVVWDYHSDFLLAGLFNALDFLASNSAFSRAAASFVETIKSSDPITTAAVALAWNVDRLAGAEAFCLSLLIVGVLLSTWGNAQSVEAAHGVPASVEHDEAMWIDSVVGTSMVLVANLCFAFRAMFQKRYRSKAFSSSEEVQLDDTNLLCRMQQTGALALALPVVMAHTGTVVRAVLRVQRNDQLYYIGLSMFNAICYSCYNLASSYVLSKLSVLQHSSLNCLRRMFAIVATCIFFRVPVTLIGALGLLTSFSGFFAFTYVRNHRKGMKESTQKDSIV